MDVKSIKLAICDDVELVRIEVHNYLKRYFAGKRLKIEYFMFSDGIDVLDSEEQIDVIILDIKMNYMDGFTLRDELFKKRAHTKIIFLTDYDNMVHEAFGKNVYGFVSKNHLDELSHYLNVIVNEYKEHELLYLSGEVIDLYNIVYIKANNGYCEFYDTQGKQRIYRILISEVAQKLNEYSTIKRTHRSYMVNFRFVTKCDMTKVHVEFDKNPSGIDLPVSHRFIENVQKTFFEFVRMYI